MLQSRLSQNIVMAVLAIITVLVLLWGWSNAVASSRSKAVLKDARAITQGFKYFYNDQNRYPSTGEFTNSNLMRSYINNFPPQTFSSSVCAKSFDYYNATPKTYELRICLLKATEGYKAGWNVFKQ